VDQTGPAPVAGGEAVGSSQKVIPKTDQTDCFEATGISVPCPGTGQDAALRVGASWPEPRFLCQDKTVLDQLTGLMWTKDASLTHFPLLWQEALTFVEDMNRSKALGYGGWRLPNRKELFSLVSHSRVKPSLPSPHPFQSVFSGYYWTSTTCIRLPGQAWYVHFGGGRVFKGMKHGSYMVWPVRNASRGTIELPESGQKTCFDEVGKSIACPSSGQDGALREGAPWPKPRFVEEDYSVTDRLTGLMWTKDAGALSEPADWCSAFGFVDRLNEARPWGYDDWRLPNIRELESLLDMDRHSPALPAGHPFEGIGPSYWSSTTSTYDPRYAWVLHMEDGAVGVGYKNQPFCFLWAVRGGRKGDPQ
jgi:hypothetical protein